VENASHATERQQPSTVSRTEFAQDSESTNAIGVSRTRVAQNSESTNASNVSLLLAVNVIWKSKPNTKKRYLNSVSKTNKR
jgi:hypothetical protein